MVETWHRRSSQVGQERIEGVNVRNGQCKAVDEEKENMTSSTLYRMLRFIVLSGSLDYTRRMYGFHNPKQPLFYFVLRVAGGS